MKEFHIEDNKPVDLKRLQTERMSQDQFITAHKSLILVCHDCFIEYKGGILLVTRNNLPAKDILWPIGGRAIRGLTIEKSLENKVKEECNLDITKVQFLGCSRTTFQTDPFGHGKGTDSFNIVYFAHGTGELRLDKLHKSPALIVPNKTPQLLEKNHGCSILVYTQELKNKLHPYVQEYLDKAITHLKS